MQKRIATRARWLFAFAALAGLLAACAGIPGTASTPAGATIATTAATTTLVTSTTVPGTGVQSPTPNSIGAGVNAPTSTVMATLAPAATAVATSAAPATPGATDAATIVDTPAATATSDPAVAAVLAYLGARARADVTAVTNLSCKTWKPKAVTEAVSFRSMNARLVGVTCQVNGTTGNFTLVGCGGKMLTTYGTESREWDLSAFVYQVTAEDGQWKMCGYH